MHAFLIRWPERALLAAVLIVAPLMLIGIYHTIKVTEQRMIEAVGVKVAEAFAQHALGTRSAYAGNVYPGAAGEGTALPMPDEFMADVRDQVLRLGAKPYAYRWLTAHAASAGRLDDFQRRAWTDIEAHAAAHPHQPEHWRPVWQLGSGRDGRDGHLIRYVRAASAGAPGKLALALEVAIPIEHVTPFAALQTRSTRDLLLGAGMLALTMLAIQAIAAAMRQRGLARRYERMAKIDSLTGLANRLAIEHIMKERLAMAGRDGTGLGVLLIDIDDFKNINDSLGHAAGDEVLRVIARRMRDALREGDAVARYSGDEFVVLADSAAASHLAAVATKLLEAATPVIPVQGNDLFVTLSIGIAYFPCDGDDVPTLLRHADSAMYRVKENGRNGFQFFAAEMNDAALEKLQMSSSLRHGLKRNEFLVHYQPKAEARTGVLVGFEALVRWHHPEHGILSPGRFIQHAEKSGAIEPLGEWVLRAALAQARAWRDVGFAGTMAVNLSMRQLYNRELPTLVRKALAEYGIEPRRLELEVTESMVSHNPEMAARALGELHRMGVSIAIDDFGTGQSSLAYLLRFPFSTLKIDRSFVAEVPLCADARSIVRAIIALGHSLRMKLVAEGVESTGQRAFLELEGCDEVQGYLISMPLAPHEATKFLEKQSKQRAPEAPLQISADVFSAAPIALTKVQATD